MKIHYSPLLNDHMPSFFGNTRNAFTTTVKLEIRRIFNRNRDYIDAPIIHK
jgi:hypothetical protein